jgi:broad specificity phosphatase PhoE
MIGTQRFPTRLLHLPRLVGALRFTQMVTTWRAALLEQDSITTLAIVHRGIIGVMTTHVLPEQPAATTTAKVSILVAAWSAVALRDMLGAIGTEFVFYLVCMG